MLRMIHGVMSITKRLKECSVVGSLTIIDDYCPE